VQLSDIQEKNLVKEKAQSSACFSSYILINHSVAEWMPIVHRNMSIKPYFYVLIGFNTYYIW